MTDAPTPLTAETPAEDVAQGAPRVKVLLTIVEGADLDAALSAVRRQVYDLTPALAIVGQSDAEFEDAEQFETLDEAIGSAESDTEYLWILHADARPRPDALSALVHEVERADASLGGSKLLVAGSHDVLESVGSATDVFGEPYSGLDEGEIDLQQYDVVREVAFVSSASMLVRRDLAQGLAGLDPKLPPVAAGLDFSQRARLAGGRVISVPSSEVYHQGRCEEGATGWREEAGRLRAMVVAYSPLTLLWVLPYGLLVALMDGLANLLLLRWRPGASHVMSLLWNAFRLPSTIGRRRKFRSVRSLGDEELFRFQARGAVRLRAVGSELSNRLLSLFDEDQALARGSRRIWESPGIWGAVLGVFVLGFAMRSLILVGVPNVGASFPFEPGTISLDRWWAGWNDSGLGSSSPVHPFTGLGGLVSVAWFGAEGAARTLMTIGFGVAAVAGMGRLGGRLGLRGPGRYLSGLVLLSGPGTTLLAGVGTWVALGAAAFLPWAVRASLTHIGDNQRSWMTRYGWALLIGLVLASLNPVLVLVPLVVALFWKVLGGREARIALAIVMLLGLVVSAPFLIGDIGWLVDPGRRLGLGVDDLWPLILMLVFAPLLLTDLPARRVGSIGVVLGLSGLLLFRLPEFGPGVEEAVLVMASFGAALLVGAGLDRIRGGVRQLMAIITAGFVLVLSVGGLVDGRLGLPAGDLNEELGFAVSLADELGPGRILLASTSRSDIPGEARPGPGYWYRLVDGDGMTQDEVLLAEPLPGDKRLSEVLDTLSTGSVLRPGDALAPFAIDWVVLSGPQFRLDQVFVAQLDLIPTPFDPERRVFENPKAAPLADAGPNSAWVQTGTGFTGDAGSGRVLLSLNYTDGWAPDAGPVEWGTSLSAISGSAEYRGPVRSTALALGAVALALIGMTMVIVGRVKR